MSAKDIITAVVLAQIASDGGKKKHDLKNQLLALGWHKGKVKYAFDKGYVVKDQFIEMACKLIRKEKPKNISYYFGEDTFYDCNNDEQTTAVIYFTFKIKGYLYQISFHSFHLETQVDKKEAKSFQVAWDRRNSSHTCLAVVKKMFFKEEKTM